MEYETNHYGYIYLTTNLINNKKYIGKSTFKSNHSSYLGSGTLLKKAIEKYGRNNFSKEILQYADTKEELEKMEEYWIEKYKAVEDENYYNIKPTSIGGNTFIYLTPEQQEKIKEQCRINGLNKKGYKHSEEAKSHMGRYERTKEIRLKMSISAQQRDNSNIGKYERTEEIKNKISESHKKARMKNQEHFKKLDAEVAKRFSKAIVCYDLEGNFIKYFNSSQEAIRQGYATTTVYDVFRGRIKTHKNKIWKRFDELDENEQKQIMLISSQADENQLK